MENVVQTSKVAPPPKPASPGGTSILVQIYPVGPNLGARYTVGAEPLLIGRAGHCDVPVADESVSRLHARVVPGPDGYYAADLESTNGTWINNVPVTRGKLQDGDSLRVGNCLFRFLASGNVEAHYHAEVYRLSILDALTEIPHKRYLEEFLERELKRAGRHRRPLSLVLFDVDYFKTINDEFGHLGGDHTLREVAACVRGGIRREDLIARYGGDEFAIALPETDLGGAVAVSEQVRRLVEMKAFEYEERPYRLTISLGVTSTAGEELLTPSELIRRADVKLYQAKRQNRNRVMA